MTTVQCNSCKATYSPQQADGSAYFHACSPDVVTTPAVFDAAGKITAPEARAPRANIRNENLILDPQTKQATIVSAGNGVTVLP